MRFARKATVCIYITPDKYPTEPRAGIPLKFDREAIEALGVKIYFAKVGKGAQDNEVLTTTSRAIALVGMGDLVAEAEAKVAKALSYVRGEYHARRDIGKGVREQVPTKV